MKNIIILTSCIFLMSCVSKAPATKFYSFFNDTSLEVVNKENKKSFSLGVARVSLPGYLMHPSITSRTETQQIKRVSSYAWAEQLDEAVNRKLASNLSIFLDDDTVLSFPWERHFRPEKHVYFNVNEFDGTLGDKVNLSATWTFFDFNEDNIILEGACHYSEPLSNASYDQYVNAMNALLDRCSKAMAIKFLNYK